MSDLDARVRLLEAQMKTLMLTVLILARRGQVGAPAVPAAAPPSNGQPEDLGVGVSDGVATQDVFGRR